jgi:hypothetical protein
MNGFRNFLEANANKEAKESLKKLPPKHRALIKGYKFKFETGCNLKGYPDAIGLIHLDNPKNKMIQIAAGWRYGREFAMLHEIGHLVWNNLLSKEQKQTWHKIAQKTRPKIKKNDPAVAKQDDEEFFCHSYANYFVYNKVSKYDFDEWQKFIKKITSASETP